MMEIKIYIFGAVYAISFGRSLPWMESSYLFAIERLWFDEMEVSYAVLIFKAFPRKERARA